jgi:hypothetical protein
MKARGVPVGDYLTSCCILLSGNNYAKVGLLFKFLNIGIFTETFHSDVQGLYSCPAVETYWETIKASIQDKLKGTELIICGLYFSLHLTYGHGNAKQS